MTGIVDSHSFVFSLQVEICKKLDQMIRLLLSLVTAWYVETILFTVFVCLCVGHAVNKINELWQQISR